MFDYQSIAMATEGDSTGRKGLIARSLSSTLFNKRERKLRHSVSDTADDTVLPFVIEKVRKHPDFKDQSENVIKEAAQDLLDCEYFKSQFSEFSEHQFVNAAAGVRKEADADIQSDSEETEVAALRSSSRLKEVCNLEIKLCLSKLDVWSQSVTAKFASLLEAQYGPTHAALLIGNEKLGYLSFEWDCNSLVVPQFCERPDTVFLARIPSEVNLVHHRLEDQMQAAGRKLNYNEQIEILFEASTVKARMLDRLIEVVLTYNKYYYFHSLSRNCQHFVSDALRAMEIRNPHNFSGRLKEYFEQLKKGFPNKPPSFRSHADLDAHVQENIVGATNHDLEFFLCLYFHFHVLSRSQSPNPREWQCEVESCQVANVEQRISRANLLLNQFS